MNNFTLPKEAFDINNNSLFNPSCISDLTKLADRCTDFRVEVIHTVTTRFKVSLMLLGLIILFKLWIEYSKPKFSQTEFYIKNIKYRIDFIEIIVLICTIGLLYI